FGLDWQISQSAARENAAIGMVHLVINGVELVETGPKAVRVFHDEFAGPQDAESRPLLVAKFRLYLKQANRKLAIRIEMPADEIGDDLFMRRPQGQVDLAITALHVKVDQHVAESFLATGLFKQIDWLQVRHEQFDRSGPLHLFAYDLFRLADAAPAQ